MGGWLDVEVGGVTGGGCLCMLLPIWDYQFVYIGWEFLDLWPLSLLYNTFLLIFLWSLHSQLFWVCSWFHSTITQLFIFNRLFFLLSFLLYPLVDQFLLVSKQLLNIHIIKSTDEIERLKHVLFSFNVGKPMLPSSPSSFVTILQVHFLLLL